jgi:hypothetical protein
MYELKDAKSELERMIILKRAQEEYESQGELPEEFCFTEGDGAKCYGYGIPLILLLPVLDKILQKLVETEFFLRENLGTFFEKTGSILDGVLKIIN